MATHQFPIQQPEGIAPMKNISPLVLPRFHGRMAEDPDEFLFEFDILCRSYDYVTNAQKLKLFPATLKDNTLRWFMSLGGGTVVIADFTTLGESHIVWPSPIPLQNHYSLWTIYRILMYH